MDYPGRLIAGLITVILIILFPLQYIAQSNSEDIDAIVSDETKALADTIRDKGYIDQDMYEEYMNFLNETGEFYDVELEDIHPVTGDEIASSSEANSAQYGAQSETKYESFSASFRNVSLNDDTALIGANTYNPFNLPDYGILNSPIPFDTENHRSIVNKSVNTTSNIPNTISNNANILMSSINSDYEQMSISTNSSDTPVILVRISSNYNANRGDGYLENSLNKGVSWTRALSLSNETFTDITYANGKFFAFTSRGAMYHSSDGVNWTCVNNIVGNNRYIRQVVYRDGIFYGLCVGSAYLFTSNDGFSWTQRGRAGGTHMKLANGMIFITPATSSSNQYFYYIKPGSYEVLEAELPRAVFWGDITYYKGSCYIIAYLDTIYMYKTSDFINWEVTFYSTSDPRDTFYLGMTNFIPVNDELYVLGSGKVWKGIIYSIGFGLGLSQVGSLPYSGNDYSKYIYTYDGEQIYLTREVDDINATKDFVSWTKQWTLPSYNRNFTAKIVCNADNGCGDVRPAKTLSSISAAPSSQTINRLSNPSFTVTANYSDGTSAVIGSSLYKVTGFDSSRIGNQTITISYTENGITKTCTVNVHVKGLTSISAAPSSQIIDRLSNPSFTVIAYYSNGTSAVIGSSLYSVTGFDSSRTGGQTVTISYSENGITKTCTATVNVNGLTSIFVTPAVLTVERYTPVSSLIFTVTASYLYGSNRIFTSGYSITGYNPSLLGQQTVTVSYTERSITKSTTAKVNVTVLHKVCPRCHNTYDLRADDVDPGCPFCKELITGIIVTPEHVEVSKGEVLPITVEAVYNNGDISRVYGWTSNYNSNKTGVQTVNIEYAGYTAVITVSVKEAMLTCPVCGTKYPASAGACPVCSEKVVSISVIPGSVTVRQNENINLTVTAYYADGTRRIVNDWSIDRTSAQAGRYRATVTYRTATANIDLTVIAVTDNQCPICGLIYNPVENPNGCPVCFTTLTGIEAYLSNGSNKVIYGTTPGIAVVLIFRDEHRELITDGYTLENYDPHKLGIQTITVKYKGFSATLTIEVVNTLSSVTCPKGHLYYLDENGTDPGCPFCKLDDSISTVYYYDITYSSDILDKVYSTGIYYFPKGNFITIRLIKRDKSLSYKLQRMFFNTSMLGRKKTFLFGGEVFY
jgi:hypothetical protein